MYTILMALALMSLLSCDVNLEKQAECSMQAMENAVISPKVNRYVTTKSIPQTSNEEYWDEEEIETTFVYAAVEDLAVRNKPSSKGEVINNLPYGMKIRVEGIATNYLGGSDTYYKIANMKLYVSASLVVDHEPKNVQLNVKNILQNPELPDGCEVTSLTIALNYIGIPADKCDLADNYLPKSTTLDADPNEFYLRNPRTNGFYCFAGPIVKTVENYNEANGTKIGATDLTGIETEKLYEYIDGGLPVVVWGTLYWNQPWKYESGLYSNLHCMVLSGYTETTVTIVDPIYGYTTVDKKQFERVFWQMGSRAVLVYNY